MALPLSLILGAFTGGLLVPWTLGRVSAHAIALVPLGVFVALFVFGNDIVAAGGVSTSLTWVESLDISVSLRIDAFALLFATLIAGIGTLVVVYGASYLAGDPARLTFLMLIVLFMASMLGAVFADDVILFFLFWELTSVISFLLIGFKSENAEARRSATQALIVTAGGGLALLAGLLMLAHIAGTTQISAIVAEGDTIAEHALFPAAIVLVLAGAFTKSAQVPFQFWLGNAMAAPTPASAYLHSATMVKLGVFLLIVLDPAFGHTVLWQALLGGVGGATMLVAAVQALRVEEFKAVLAQTTVAALGTLTLLVGLDDPIAAIATVGFFLSHALYKAALFFVAGNVIHATGEARLSQISGLYRALPLTAVAGVVACLSMAGLPPFVGFIAKEYLFEAKLEAAGAGVIILVAVAVIVNAVLVAVAAVLALKPFFGRTQQPATLKHRETPGLTLGPVVLAAMGALFGLVPGVASSAILADAINAVAGTPLNYELKLWQGLTPMLALSALAVASGILLALNWRRVHDTLARVPIPAIVRSEDLGDRLGSAVLRAARATTGVMQNGSLRIYTLVPLTLMGLVIIFSLVRGGIAIPDVTFDRPYLALIVAVMVIGSVLAALARSFLTVLIAVGLVGYALGILFLKKGAPDLAFTQFAVETIFVVVATAIVLRLPFKALDMRTSGQRLLDGGVALVIGVAGTLLAISVMAVPFDERVSDFFRLASLTEAYGRNVVNVIIVDFRALDTLGEIGVVALAALAAFGLMRGLRIRTRRTLP